MSQAEQEPQTPLAATRMNELGLENAQLAQRVGVWDVVETIWASPGTTPMSTTHVAERTMIGPFFQEIIQPAPGSTVPDFRRMYYLSFHRIEGCWKYVSLDTRNPVGLMPATSFGPGEPGRIDLRFEPFAVPGPGAEVTGQMLRMEETISLQDADHDIAEERFMMADGSGQVVLAYKYEYTRKGGAMATGEQNFTVTSSQFKDGDTMPNSAVHPMAGGQNISPDLLWAGAPEGTASFAVSMYDPDAPTTVGFAHWLLFNLDPSITSLSRRRGRGREEPAGLDPRLHRFRRERV